MLEYIRSARVRVRGSCSLVQADMHLRDADNSLCAPQGLVRSYAEPENSRRKSAHKLDTSGHSRPPKFVHPIPYLHLSNDRWTAHTMLVRRGLALRVNLRDSTYGVLLRGFGPYLGFSHVEAALLAAPQSLHYLRFNPTSSGADIGCCMSKHRLSCFI